MKYIKLFLKNPQNYVAEIKNIKTNFFVMIVLFFLIIKIIFNYSAPTDFPPDFSYEKAGIVNPSLIDFIISSLISAFINFFIFAPIFIIGIKKLERTSKFILFSITFTIIGIIFASIKIKTITVISVIIIPVILYFLIKKYIIDYIFFVKILVSLEIIQIIAKPLISISQHLKSEKLFTLTNIIFAIVYLLYLLKTIKSRYEITIPKIILVSLFSFLLSIIYGFIIYSSQIFAQNTITLILMD